MTDQQINIAIAELCGWKLENYPGGSLPMGASPPGWPKSKVWWWVHQLPDYCNDLNAMWDAEQTLCPHWLPPTRHGTDDSQWDMFICELSKITGYGPTHATARERAEAFLRVNGKWVEE